MGSGQEAENVVFAQQRVVAEKKDTKCLLVQNIRKLERKSKASWHKIPTRRAQQKTSPGLPWWRSG